MLINNSVPKKL